MVYAGEGSVMALWCGRCGKGLEYTLRLATCPSCEKPADWWTECPVPRNRWNVSADDWLFLMVIGVNPERFYRDPLRSFKVDPL